MDVRGPKNAPSSVVSQTWLRLSGKMKMREVIAIAR
jgi:hypothetical protein